MWPKKQEVNLDKAQSQLLRDLYATYDMQIIAMKKASGEGNLTTAVLHSKMAEQLLQTYFDCIEEALNI